jgi:Tfp pilus assembly protein PilP
MQSAKHSRRTLLLFGVGTLFSSLLLSTPLKEIFAQELSSEDTYQYNPTGKRDPFFSPLYRVTEQTTMESDESKTPLQRLDLGQFKVVGIILETGEPRALIEDNSGLGYIVTSGTLIGPKGGVIKSIEPSRILVEEYETDFYGKRQVLEREMPLTVAESTDEGRSKVK